MTQPDDNRPAIRVGDAEREITITHLAKAHSIGQLDLAEFDERSAAVVSAKTNADLAALTADLPLATIRSTTPAAPMSAQSAVARGNKRAPFLRGTWLALVAMNVAIWGIVSITSGQFVYFWPIWVAVGFGIPAFLSAMDRRGK